MVLNSSLQQLANSLEGECHYDHLLRVLYATDASVYRQLPAAVVLPKTVDDLRKVIAFANEQGLSIIPRAAGTSLAGQVVGSGIVVDISKYMNHILEVNVAEQWVRVQPGVIRDELNTFLALHGLYFGPDTSTANRCMLGGMVGNNSCGTTSIVYGSTRDHVVELHTLLSDGSEVVFQSLTEAAFRQKCQGTTLENKIYRQLEEVLSDPQRQETIRNNFPKPSIHRRNTGYAIDELLETNVFTPGKPDFNMCRLLAGSEGTLAFTTEIKLHVNALPDPEIVVVCPHFTSIRACMRAVLIAMKHEPTACEMMDKIILDLTKQNIEQLKNRYFVEGDPEAILMVEFRGKSKEEIVAKADSFLEDLRQSELAYAYPQVFGQATKKVWDLRKAGLGILANLPGDPKAVACIEDTAVDIQDLPDYIDEFAAMMEGYGQKAVYYAHAGAGEIHLRPILDLKKASDQQLFHDITESTAKLVKKYRGSLSGEHGDGRVRAEFIPLMIGEENYQLLRDLKQTWDPQGLFNPGKIVDAPPMNSTLRYRPNQETTALGTVFDFSATEGILRAAEKCNGSGDCRKLAFTGGVMCPSYQVTRNEKDTTRGRANALREFLTMNTKANPFDHPEVYEAMDLCLSCKGCTAECPSNVDMSTLKAEFLHQYHKSNGIPLRSRAFANISTLNGLGSLAPGLSNFFLSNGLTGGLLKKVLSIAPQRELPALASVTLRQWFKKNQARLAPNKTSKGTVYLFCDEFTNYNDAGIGIKAIELLQRLGYAVLMPAHAESGRAHLSKGLLDEAQKLAAKNVAIFQNLITEDKPLLGIEPSAILSFRDEYPKLVRGEAQKKATDLAKNVFLIDEFLASEAEKGKITPAQFTSDAQTILLHGHCHQKALSSVAASAFLLSLPSNYQVEVIPSGCCGMAGSFGYEAEHYEVSMKIGELVLFPAVRKAGTKTMIAAPGTSCRHQVKDGTGRQALHPVEILWAALREA